MAVRLLSYEIADLCLGKPPIKSLSLSSTVGDAVATLRSSSDNYISVWKCHHSTPSELAGDCCKCVGKVCMVDVICYLCRQENLSSPSSAMKLPLSTLISKVPGLVSHVDPSSSLLEAIDLILQGTQNLVVPIKNNITSNAKRKLVSNLKPSTSSITIHNGREFCWLTQEDIIRFILSTIGLFSPLPSLSIDALDIISTEFTAIKYHSPASAALGAIADQTPVAVVDSDGLLIGEISPFTLVCCDETAAAAITTLSAGDLMSYIDNGGPPPKDMVRVVREMLKERGLEGMFKENEVVSSNIPSSRSSNSLFSDKELGALTLSKRGRHCRSSSYSPRMVRRGEPIVCHRWSSLMAVMVQAIAHRLNYVWVVEDDFSLVGIVTFSSILGVFGEHLQSMA